MQADIAHMLICSKAVKMLRGGGEKIYGWVHIGEKHREKREKWSLTGRE